MRSHFDPDDVVIIAAQRVVDEALQLRAEKIGRDYAVLHFGDPKATVVIKTDTQRTNRLHAVLVSGSLPRDAYALMSDDIQVGGSWKTTKEAGEAIRRAVYTSYFKSAWPVPKRADLNGKGQWREIDPYQYAGIGATFAQV